MKLIRTCSSPAGLTRAPFSLPPSAARREGTGGTVGNDVERISSRRVLRTETCWC